MLMDFNPVLSTSLVAAPAHLSLGCRSDPEIRATCFGFPFFLCWLCTLCPRQGLDGGSVAPVWDLHSLTDSQKAT